MRELLILALTLSLISAVNLIIHTEIESSFEISQLVITGKEFNIQQILQLGETLKSNYQERVKKECEKVGGTCPYWSNSSVVSRQMTYLLDTNLAEITNFCSGNHPNTKDRVQLGELVDMENTIPGMKGMAKMIDFKTGVIPGVDDLFQTQQSETEEDTEIFRDIDIS